MRGRKADQTISGLSGLSQSQTTSCAKLCRSLFAPVALLVLWFAFPSRVTAQTGTLVIAFTAPTDKVSECPPGSGIGTCYSNFVTNELPYISGIGTTINWAAVDDCGSSGPCSGQDPMDNMRCPPPSSMNYYNWCSVDRGLLNYIQDGHMVGKKIVLIVWPAPEPGVTSNNVTPPYVLMGATAQDMAVCSDWQGDLLMSSSSCPVRLASGHTSINPGDWAVWNNNALGACASSGSSLTCPNSTICPLSAYTDTSGFPVVYESTFATQYQNFLYELAHHYNPVTGSPNGQAIAPYIAYVRVGMAAGGENQAFCQVSGHIGPSISWSHNQTVPAGYIVNTQSPKFTNYVSIGPGTTALSGVMPTCSPAGCTTAQDGTVPGWYNAGPYTTSTPTGTAIWPGKQGLASEPNSYSDNGYLSMWPPPSTDGSGYNGSMLAYLQSLHASFPFTISAIYGPPLVGDVSYANSEAIQASFYGIGFGMEAANIQDSESYAAESSPSPVFPTSTNDWVHNFQSYPAPVHHLQTFFPGNVNYQNVVNHATGFPIASISADGSTQPIVTVTCVTDCSSFASAGSPGEPIYISNNSNNVFNGIWLTCPVPVSGSPSCASGAGKLEFDQGTSAIPNYAMGSGGVVWAPDYWPIMMPFAVQHGATSVEVYQCDIDYGYGAYEYNSMTIFPTTNWVLADTSQGGCVIPVFTGTGTPVSPVSGSDGGYMNSVTGALTGQPQFTSILAGSGVLASGWQF